MADYKNNFSASTLDMLASQGGTSEHLQGTDSVYGAASSNLPSLIDQSGSRYSDAQGIYAAAMSAANESKDISTWLDNDNFQQAINNKYSAQADQVNKGSAAAQLVGSAEVAEQVASRKIDNLEQQKEAYAEVAESAGNFMSGMALPGPLRSIVGLFVPKYNMGAQLANTAQAIQKVNNLQSQDALDDELVLQNAFGKAGYNPLANEIFEPFNKWEKQYVDEQVALQRNKIAAQSNKNSALQTALGAIQAQNHMVDTLAGIHHDETAERMNILNKANAQEERKLDYQKDQSANERNELNARVATNEQMLRAIGQEYQMKRDPIEDRQKDEALRLQDQGQLISRANKLSDQQIALLNRQQQQENNQVKLQQDETARRGQDTQLMVSQNQLEGARLRAQATETFANRPTSGGAGGSKGASSAGTAGFKPTNTMAKDALVTASTADATSRKTAGQFGRLTAAGWATSDLQASYDQLNASKQAMIEGIRSNDPSQATVAAEVFKEADGNFEKQVDQIVNNQIPNESGRKVAKQVINGEADITDPSLTGDIATSVTQDVIYSTDDEANQGLKKLNKEYSERVYNLLQSDSALVKRLGLEKFWKMDSEELNQKIKEISDSDTKKLNDAQKAMVDDLKKQPLKLINDYLDHGDGTAVTPRQAHKDDISLDIDRYSASRLGEEVNARYNKPLVDSESVFNSKEPIKELAVQMANNGLSDRDIRQAMGRLSLPSLVKAATGAFLSNTIYKKDIQAGMYHNLMGTYGFAIEARNRLAYSDEKHNEIDTITNSVLQARAEQIDKAREDATAQLLAMQGNFGSKPKLGRNTAPEAGSFYRQNFINPWKKGV
jgi:hypothetical protein